MLATASLLLDIVAWRIDVLGLLAGMLVGGAVYRGYVNQRGAAALISRDACLSALLPVVAGLFLAELPGLLVERSGTANLRAIAVARISILGACSLAGGIVLWASVRMARLRARLQAQADTERGRQSAKLAAEGERLGALIDDLLDLFRIDNGQLVIARVPFAPAEVAAEVLRLFAVRAGERKIDLRCKVLIAGPLLVVGDPLRFRQILVNLVDNALKFTPKGAVTVFLTWSAPEGRHTGGKLTGRVRDTGSGIPANKLPGLFQMFTPGDSSTTRTHGGTGLGLAICHRLVGLMGGEISVQSTLGAGTEFKFWLPLPPVPTSELPTLDLEPAIAFATPPRILVVDDRDTNRFLLEVFLRRSGFEPELASGGEEAVRLATANRYDAILMDLQMPVVDGYMATARIRAAEAPGRRTVIIALTASLARGTRERCFAAGMDEHLIKPLELDQFRRVLSRLLAASASPRAIPAAVNG